MNISTIFKSPIMHMINFNLKFNMLTKMPQDSYTRVKYKHCVR